MSNKHFEQVEPVPKEILDDSIGVTDREFTKITRAHNRPKCGIIPSLKALKLSKWLYARELCAIREIIKAEDPWEPTPEAAYALPYISPTALRHLIEYGILVVVNNYCGVYTSQPRDAGDDNGKGYLTVLGREVAHCVKLMPDHEFWRDDTYLNPEPLMPLRRMECGYRGEEDENADDENEDENLKPCPLCGGYAEMDSLREVMCSKCEFPWIPFEQKLARRGWQTLPRKGEGEIGEDEDEDEDENEDENVKPCPLCGGDAGVDKCGDVACSACGFQNNDCIGFLNEEEWQKLPRHDQAEAGKRFHNER